ncbi:DUF6443 domain-containing protein [Maribacter sp. 2-571]|uniref:DUF6443 domain-containing protein n=1 Tax=Maribacter sp. 2-571 TaxID=3417569 RepID=UPI003D327C18
MKHLFLLFVFLLTGSVAVAQVSPEEKQALQDFYNATGGPGWTSENDDDPDNDWDFSGPVTSDWEGVNINNGDFYNLSLGRNNLVGTIPESIGDLINLRSIFLYDNQLSGSIPDNLAQLANLTSLSLGKNPLSGNLQVLRSMTNLRNINLQQTEYAGSIPQWLGELSSLTSLNLGRCRFTGEIPESLSQLRNLYSLYLNNNQLTGEIPKELGQLSSLTLLYLENNQLNGGIPDSFGNLTNLEYLMLHDNQLSGSIPMELFQLPNLVFLHLGRNNLSGSVPEQRSSLTFLFLENNSLTGVIPGSIMEFPNMIAVDLSYNQFTGELPSNYNSQSKISYFNFANNQLTGNIPESIFSFPELAHLYVNDNLLSGSIPSNVVLATNLQDLHLENNQFSGVIPEDIGQCEKLRNLSLNANQLTGSIPVSIESLQELQFFNLYNNSLEGVIPENIGLLNKLEVLQVHSNRLTGSIPSSLGNLDIIKTIRLDGNRLTGNIPQSLTNLSELVSLYLNDNSVSGDIPDLSVLTNLSTLYINENDFQYGDFEGEYPAYLNITNFQYSNQSPVGEIETLSENEGGVLTLTAEVSGAQNHYRWLKDGVPVSGAPDAPEFVIDYLIPSDAGVYSCEVTSDIVADLTILRNPVTVEVQAGVPLAPSGYNYVYGRTYQNPVTDTPATLFEESADYVQNITYFDGLGRPIQSNAIGQSPVGNADIVTHIGYDAYGRQAKEWLPYAESRQPKGRFKTGDVARQTQSYYQNNYNADFLGMSLEEINAYSEKQFESSPLNRVEKQAAPGKDWKIGNGHEIAFAYQTNTITDEVKQFSVDTPNTPLQNTYVASLVAEPGFHRAGTLYKNVIRDENHSGIADDPDHTTEEFVDKEGRTVLKRTYNNGERHDTYYVYDDFGNLTYVLPPKMEGDSTEMDVLGYQYTYDHRNRLVEKQLPGKGVEYIVYNRLDQPILTQDANQREKDNDSDEWLFTKYDAFGRVAYTGKATAPDGTTRADIQAEADAFSGALWVSRTTAANTIGGGQAFYNNGAYPNADPDAEVTVSELLTVDYYDTYLDHGSGAPSAFTPLGGTNPVQISEIAAKGLPTVRRVKVLGVEEDFSWITSRTYYDEKGRAIHTHTQNDYLATTDILEMELDFIGKPIKTRSSHIRNGNTIVTIDNFTYDTVGRLLSQTQCIGDDTLGNSCVAGGTGNGGLQNLIINGETVSNVRTASNSIRASNSEIVAGGRLRIGSGSLGSSGKEELIVGNTYDAMGQLVVKKVGGSPNAGGLQQVNYSYNVRGWLTDINDVGSTDKLFNFRMNYNNPQNGAMSLYNGNISETQWRTANVDDSSLKYYTYSYDALNRITDAAGNMTGNRYDISDVSYDKNGNIQKLKRNGHTNNSATAFGLMDDLSYTYTGNQLQSVMDSGASTGFIDGNPSGYDYVYDQNGNMIRDDNKGIRSIKYNHLNLPRIMDLGEGDIHYAYTADGTKLQKYVFRDGEPLPPDWTDYAGNYIYKNGVLQFFRHSEGYVSVANGNYEYVYNYTDHLGNVRLSYTDADGDGEIDASSEIISEKNYYPFGLEHKGYNNNVLSLGNPVAKKYMFGGKEYQDELDLKWYDISARNYDPALGRWMNIDPLAEMMRRHSPYNYAFDNPVYFIDPDGMMPGPPDIISKVSNTKRADKRVQRDVSVTLTLSVVAGENDDLSGTIFSGGSGSVSLSDFEGRADSYFAPADLLANDNVTDFTVEFNVVSSLDDVGENDHVLVLVDEIPQSSGDESNPVGLAQLGGRVSAVERGTLADGSFDEVAQHELGHNTGLPHNDNIKGLMSTNVNGSTSLSGADRGRIVSGNGTGQLAHGDGDGVVKDSERSTNYSTPIKQQALDFLENSKIQY